MNKTKIAFVTPIYSPAILSGSTVIVKNLAEKLAQKGYNCTIITSQALNTRFWYDPIFGKKTKKKFETINGVKVHRLGCNQLFSFLALILIRFFKPLLPSLISNKLELFYCGPSLIGLRKLLSLKKFDIIYSSPLPAYLNKQVARSAEKIIPKPKLILGACFHPQLPDYHNPELTKFASQFNLIHVFTHEEKRKMRKIFQIPKNKFRVIPPFLRLSTMKTIKQTQNEVKSFKKKFKLKKKKIILFAAGKIKEKGIYTLMKAMKKLTQDAPNLKLITIGNSNLTSWKKYIQKTKPDFLLDLGYVSKNQKEIIFSASNIYCMPSTCESFGLTYLEAWQKKKPVIAANFPVTKQLISNAKGGLLVKFGNEKELEKAIKKLAENNQLAQKLGKNGYKAVKMIYNSQHLISKFENLFQNI